MIPIMLIFEPPPHRKKHCHHALKNIQTKNREREIQLLPLESKRMIVASPSKENCHRVTVTTAADVPNYARYNPAVNVDGGPSPAALDIDTDNGGAGNTLVQAAVVSVVLIATKSSARSSFTTSASTCVLVLVVKELLAKV